MIQIRPNGMCCKAASLLLLALALAACCSTSARPLGEASIGDALTLRKLPTAVHVRAKAAHKAGRGLAECSDLASNCGDLQAYCDPFVGWTAEGQPISTYWCPATCGQCSNGDSSSSSSSPAPPSGWEQELLGLVNTARAQAGLPSLCLNSKLSAAAQAHSQDQADRQDMGHDGSDGSSSADRIARAGYSYGWAGENVAVGYGSVGEVFEGWMNSEGHRANILKPEYQHMGAGRVDSNRPYWTQNFGSSDSEGCS